MFMLYSKSVIRCDTGKVRDRCGGMGGLRCKGRVNSVITNVIGLTSKTYSKTSPVQLIPK